MESNILNGEKKELEFYITTERMELAISQHKELAQLVGKYLPSEAPKSITDAYKNLADAYMSLIIEEAKFLASLK